MKRVLALLAASGALVFSTAANAGPSLTASIYAPDIEVGASDAGPDGLLLDLRFPLNSTFWLGGTLATSLSEDTTVGGTDVEVGTSLTLNLGVQSELSHNVFGYGYLGYGTSEVLASGAGASDLDGMGVTFGAGLQFLLGDNLLIDAGYVSLFDGDMEDGTGIEFSTSIAGPRVGIGAKF